MKRPAWTRAQRRKTKLVKTAESRRPGRIRRRFAKRRAARKAWVLAQIPELEQHPNLGRLPSLQIELSQLKSEALAQGWISE